MQRYHVDVTVGLTFEDTVDLSFDTVQEVEARMKAYVEQVLFSAIPGTNLALDVRVKATQVEKNDLP